MQRGIDRYDMFDAIRDSNILLASAIVVALFGLVVLL